MTAAAIGETKTVSGRPVRTPPGNGAVAQLGEHHVRNVGVGGSNPLCSTISPGVRGSCPGRSFMIEVLGLPAEQKFHRFILLEAEDFVRPPDRTENDTILEVQMMSGRTEETKKRLIHALLERVEVEAGIDRSDLEICLLESPPENWGFWGFAGDEVKLSYKVNL